VRKQAEEALSQRELQGDQSREQERHRMATELHEDIVNG